MLMPSTTDLPATTFRLLRRPIVSSPSVRTLDTIVISTIVLCIPFIQHGINVYLSFQVLAFALLAIAVITTKPFLSHSSIFAMALVVMMVPLLPFFDSPYSFHSLLKAGREWVCYGVLYAAIKNAAYIRARFHYSEKLIRFLVFLFVFALLAGVVIQYFYLRRGVLWFVPADYFAMNVGTIPTALDLKWSRLRPSGPFGEPSYAGFVASSLLMVLFYSTGASLLKLWALAAVLGIVVVCQTFSGMLAVFALMGVYFMVGHASRTEKRMGWALAVFAVVLLFATGHYQVLGRLMFLVDSSVDSSSNSRILVPLNLVAHIFVSYPWGIPTDEIGRVFASDNLRSILRLDGAIANGVLNVLINYGVFGFWLLYLLISAVRFSPLSICFLVSAGMFNGGLFTYDKVAIIGLVFILIAGQQRDVGRGTRPLREDLRHKFDGGHTQDEPS